MEGQEWGKRRDRAEGSESAERRPVADRVERILMQLVILGLVAVVLVQALAVNPALRRKLNLLEGTEGYELAEDSSWWQMLTADTSGTATGPADRQGTPQAVAAAPTAKKYTLTVQLETRRTAPKAKLLVDGKAVGDFRTGQATVLVEPGDLVEVDGSEYNEALTFRVVAAQGLASPPLSEEFSTRASTAKLGVVARRGR